MADTVEAQAPQPGKSEQAQEKAQEVAGEARSRMREQLDQRSTQAGERISSTGSDLRSVSQELQKQGKDAPARLAEQAAERVERVGGYLADSNADRILHDVEEFGRRQPLAVLAGGMVIGMVAARFLKASSHRRYQSSTAGSNGANHPSHAQRTVSAIEPATPGVRASEPDPGEHHQRFEGHG
jgi:hypothetical protein